MATMTYKEAIAKLSVSAANPVIIDNDDIILLKVDGCYNLVRNDGVNLIQTRFKTVHSLEELEELDDWMDKNADVGYEDFKDEGEAVFKFRLMVIAATHRDIVL